MRALLLIGSPRKGASWKLGSALLETLAASGMETEAIFLSKGLKSSWQEVEAAVQNADLLILSAPLYVDTLPALAMEALTKLRGKAAGKGLTILLNCGFPEPAQNETAMEICRQFAREANCRWLGGLAFSMGGFSFGKGPSRRAKNAFFLAAGALARGNPVPEDAVKIAARPPMRKWLYLMILNKMFRRINRKHGKMPLDAQPYRN